MWRKGKRDKNDNQIINDLKEKHPSWRFKALTNQVLDYLVWTPLSGTVILEIKGQKTTFQRSQIKFISEWPGHIGIAKTFEQAEDFLSFPLLYGVTVKQKEKLAGLLLIDKRETFPAKFLEDFLEQWK